MRVETHDGHVTGVVCIPMELDPSSAGRALARPSGGPEFFIPADQIVKAIGQQKPGLAAMLGLQTNGGFLRVNEHFETSLPGVYAGGDCIRAKNSASTVMAVQDGKLSAAAIHERIMRQAHG